MGALPLEKEPPMKATNRSNKILAIAAMVTAIAAADGAHATTERAVSGSARPIYSALEAQMTHSASALDYRVEVMGGPWQNGGIGKLHQTDSESVLFVRLVRSSDGMPLTNADVSLSRVDMSPDGMGDLTARSYIRPAANPGAYRVEIHPSMGGRWAVTVAARVAGEAEPVRLTLTVALAH
jgi:hypothetical protein